MMTDNALDPPPASRRAALSRQARIAGLITAAFIVVALVVVVGRMVLQPPALANRGGAGDAAFSRSSAAFAPNTPPAVTPALAETTAANLRAMHWAASASTLAARPLQVASVSPPAGPPPSGVGVIPSRASIGPAAG